MRTSSRNSQLHGEHVTTDTRLDSCCALDLDSSSGVTDHGPRSAIPSRYVAPEEVLTDEGCDLALDSGLAFDSAVEVAADEGGPTEDGISEHECSLSVGRAAVGHLYDIWCAKCGHVAPADTFEQAQAIARLHEEFIAVLADDWSA